MIQRVPVASTNVRSMMIETMSGPTRPLNLAEPKHLQLLKDDYLRVAFTDYAKEAVAQADIKGFAKK